MADTDAPYVPPTLDLAPETIVMDVKTNLKVLTVRGSVVLPVGAVVHLGDPNANASVVGIRLLVGPKGSPATVVLDVEVPAEWWKDK